MKKLATLLLFILFISKLIAQPFFNNSLILSLENNSYFAVKIDNRIFPAPQKKFILENILPGQHFLEIVKYKKNSHHLNNNPVTISARWINIPANATVTALMDGNRQIRIKEIISNYYVYNSNFNAPGAVSDCSPVNEKEFHFLVESILGVSFESSRLNIAKQAISQKHFNANQIKKIMELMWFESSKLEIAKFGFKNTVDKENYYKVNGAFQFDSSVLELNDFIIHS